MPSCLSLRQHENNFRKCYPILRNLQKFCYPWKICAIRYCDPIVYIFAFQATCVHDITNFTSLVLIVHLALRRWVTFRPHVYVITSRSRVYVIIINIITSLACAHSYMLASSRRSLLLTSARKSSQQLHEAENTSLVLVMYCQTVLLRWFSHSVPLRLNSEFSHKIFDAV